MEMIKFNEGIYFKRLLNNAACKVAEVMGVQMPKQSKPFGLSNTDMSYEQFLRSKEKFMTLLDNEDTQAEIEKMAILKYERAKKKAFKEMLTIDTFDGVMKRVGENGFAIITNWEKALACA